MNSNYNVKKIYKAKMKYRTTYLGLHPEGGFVAWPNGKVSRIKHDQTFSKGRCVNRKGFVAWPVKD